MLWSGGTAEVNQTAAPELRPTPADGGDGGIKPAAFKKRGLSAVT